MANTVQLYMYIDYTKLKVFMHGNLVTDSFNLSFTKLWSLELQVTDSISHSF